MSIFDEPVELEQEPVTMTVQRGDLAAIAFHTKDIIAGKTAHLEKRRLEPGVRVRIAIEFEVIETPSGGLIFGNFNGSCEHG